MLQTRIIEKVSELEKLVPAWRRLLSVASRAEPVMTPLWLLTWWRIFGEADGRAMRVIAVEDGDDLIGLVPLSLRNATHRPAIPVRRVELLATGEDEADEIGSDYVGGLVARSREADVAGAMAHALAGGDVGDWDELRMTAMNGDDPFVSRLAAALDESGLRATISTTSEAPYIPLPKTWQEYLQALGSSSRYGITRGLRDLEKLAGPGGWELRTAKTESDLDDGKRVLRDLHGKRWAAAGRRGVFASKRFSAFHDEVMARLLRNEDGASLDLSWLLVKDVPIAATYSVVFGGKVYFYQCGRSLDLPKNMRPGAMIQALLIRRAIEQGMREYDFLAGASPYKRDFMLALRPVVELRAVAPGIRARAVEAARIFADRAIARIRDVRARRTPSGGRAEVREEPAPGP